MCVCDDVYVDCVEDWLFLLVPFVFLWWPDGGFDLVKNVVILGTCLMSLRLAWRTLCRMRSLFMLIQVDSTPGRLLLEVLL